MADILFDTRKHRVVVETPFWIYFWMVAMLGAGYSVTYLAYAMPNYPKLDWILAIIYNAATAALCLVERFFIAKFQRHADFFNEEIARDPSVAAYLIFSMKLKPINKQIKF